MGKEDYSLNRKFQRAIRKGLDLLKLAEEFPPIPISLELPEIYR
jgi:hypothetical protein